MMWRTLVCVLAAGALCSGLALAQPRQGGGTCETAVVIPGIPYNDSGSTVGQPNEHPLDCAFNASGEVWYALTPATTQFINVSLCGSSYDSALEIFSGSCAGLTALACNDDFCGAASEIRHVNVEVGTTYFIVVSGYYLHEGSYVLNANAVTCPGDMNCDWQINFEDIDSFVAILGGATPCSASNADVNGDGHIDFADIDPFVALLSSGATCP